MIPVRPTRYRYNPENNCIEYYSYILQDWEWSSYNGHSGPDREKYTREVIATIAGNEVVPFTKEA